MKLLSVSAKGLPLFKDEIKINFIAQQRVAEEDKHLLHQFRSDSDFYLNCVEAMIGINASGKTSALKVVLLALNLLNNEPVNHIQTKDILGQSPETTLEIVFYSDSDEICKLRTIIVPSSGHGQNTHYAIKEETLWTKPAASVKTKKALLDFSGIPPVSVRSNDEMYLPGDTSFIIAYNRQNKQRMYIADLLSLTNVNVLPLSDDIPLDIVAFLDPTIETLSVDREDQKATVHLKFKGKPEIILADPAELNQYLSSGTIKGIVTFNLATQVLKTGGYLIVDELENHFNKEIVATLIRLFMDDSFNTKGGTLVFTTHYPEILDEFERNDCIHIIRNRDRITINNLTDLLKRNDLKKSEAYQSGFLEGTVPAYEAYMSLKRSIRSVLKKED